MWELAKNSDYQCLPSDKHPLRSLLVVLATPPKGHQDFSELVRSYNARPPFNISSPDWRFRKVS